MITLNGVALVFVVLALMVSELSLWWGLGRLRRRLENPEAPPSHLFLDLSISRELIRGEPGLSIQSSPEGSQPRPLRASFLQLGRRCDPPVYDLVGSGSPVDRICAPRGTRYTDATSGHFYLKTHGSGSDGWSEIVTRPVGI